jgi:putative FmdB family regulatory protein
MPPHRRTFQVTIMPTYSYHCHHCKQSLEAFQKITAEPLKVCPECGESALVRGPGGGIGLQFQGSGFYITDYKNESNVSGSCQAGKDKCCPCKN